MRIRLTFEDPLPPYKCWFEVPTSCSTIRDLQKAVRKGFNLDQYCKTTRLDLDGFFLLPASTIAGSLKDGDLLQVMIRKRNDNLPPRHLPVSGGNKRSREDAGLSSTNHQQSPKKMKPTPPPKQPAASTKPGPSATAAKQGGNSQQKQKKPNARNNSKVQKDQPNNNQKAKRDNSQQKSTPKANENGKGNHSNSNNKAKSSTSNTKANTQNTKGTATTSTKGQKANNTVTLSTSTKGAKEQEKRPAATVISSSDSSSSNDSSSSDDSSSSSDSSSDDDSPSSDSSDESSSENSDSASDGSSNSSRCAENDKVGIDRKPPGSGKGRTKSRNARRKNARLMHAAAHTEAESGASVTATQDTNPSKKRSSPRSQTVNTTPADPVPQANAGKAPQTNGNIQSPSKKKVTFQAREKAMSQASATPPTPSPKVIMTSVELRDSDLMPKMVSKRVTRSSQKKHKGAFQEAAPTVTPETGLETVEQQQEDSGNNNGPAGATEEETELDDNSAPRDYSKLPKAELELVVGDVIAFKTLELGPSYTPIISDFKEATVLSMSMTNMVAVVQLARQFRSPIEMDDEGNPILGKFDIYDEEAIENARRGIVTLDILQLAECRIVSKK
ncbi:hypothetical protein EC991_006271 [Linnemannia zychae]|nr:hypothetical protein EC991_006271 [Linnemannia zychae]